MFNMSALHGTDVNVYIVKYFDQGYSNVEIVGFLLKFHGIVIGLSTLKRRLRNLGLRRRISKEVEDRDEIRHCVEGELLGSGQNLGKNIILGETKHICSGIIVSVVFYIYSYKAYR